MVQKRLCQSLLMAFPHLCPRQCSSTLMKGAFADWPRHCHACNGSAGRALQPVLAEEGNGRCKLTVGVVNSSPDVHKPQNPKLMSRCPRAGCRRCDWWVGCQVTRKSAVSAVLEENDKPPVLQEFQPTVQNIAMNRLCSIHSHSWQGFISESVVSPLEPAAFLARLAFSCG